MCIEFDNVVTCGISLYNVNLGLSHKHDLTLIMSIQNIYYEW